MSISMAMELAFLVLLLLAMWWRPSLEALLAANLLRSLGLLGTTLFVTRHRHCPLQVSWDSRLIREGTPFLLLMLLAMLRGQVDRLFQCMQTPSWRRKLSRFRLV